MGKNFQLYDLSETFEPDMPVYPGYSPPMFKVCHTLEKDGFYDRMTTFYIHTGTHMDAPRHFSKDGYTIDQIPLDVLIGPGVVLDLPKGELGEITGDDLEKAKSKVPMRKGDIVIINTGWHHKRNEPEFARKFPGIVRSGAEWLVKSEVKMLGVDWITLDHPSQSDMGDDSWASHHILMSKNIPVIERIGGEVDKVKGQRVTIIAVPVKVAEGDGFPVRVIAAIE